MLRPFDNNQFERRHHLGQFAHAPDRRVRTANNPKCWHPNRCERGVGHNQLGAAAIVRGKRPQIVRDHERLRELANLLVARHGFTRRIEADDQRFERRVAFELPCRRFSLLLVRLGLLVHCVMGDERSADESIGVGCNQVPHNDGAHRKPYDVRPRDLQMIEQADDVLPHFRAIGLRICGLAALAVSASIDGNHPVIFGQIAEDPGIDPMSFERTGIAVASGPPEVSVPAGRMP